MDPANVCLISAAVLDSWHGLGLDHIAAIVLLQATIDYANPGGSAFDFFKQVEQIGVSWQT